MRCWLAYLTAISTARGKSALGALLVSAVAAPSDAGQYGALHRAAHGPTECAVHAGRDVVYVVGRTALEQGRTRKGLLYLFVLLPAATLAAVFSKENGALVPLLCGVIELGYFLAQAAPCRDQDESYSSVCFWYCRPPPRFITTAFIRSV